MSENTYDPRVVADKVPDEQLRETRYQDDGKHGVRRPNPISEESGTTTTDSRRYVKDGDGEDGKLSQTVSPPASRDTIALDANQLGQIWDLLFGEHRQIEKWRRIPEVRQAEAQSDAPKGRVRQILFVVPDDCSRRLPPFLEEEVGSS